MILHLWGSKAATPMHSLHFGFGVGGIIAPQLARYFLNQGPLENTEPSLNSTSMAIDTSPMDTTNTSHDSLTFWGDIHPLVYPYSIIGINTLACGIVMLLFTCFGTPKGYPKREGTRQISRLFSPSSCTTGNSGIGCLLLFLLFFFYNHAVGGENNYREYIFAFSIDSEVSFTKNQASGLSSVFWISFTIGRGLGTALSKCLSQRTMLVGQIIGIIICTSILVVWGHNTSLVLWICTGALGLLVSPLFPCGLAWANLHLEMNSMAVMICILGSSSGILCYVYLTGFLLDKYGTTSFMYVELGFGILLAIKFLAMELVAARSKGEWRVEEVTAEEPFQMSTYPEEKHRTNGDL